MLVSMSMRDRIGTNAATTTTKGDSMGSEAMTLSRNGKRAYTRGWDGARHVKRATAKKSRRIARKAVRDNEGVVMEPVTKGWVW